MSMAFAIGEATFRPAEISRYFGILPVTQGQWRTRGFLGPRTSGRAAITIEEAAAMLFLKACGEAKIGLEVAARAAPAVAAAAHRYVVVSLAPLPFKGTPAGALKYEKWLAAHRLTHVNVLDAMLGSLKSAEARHWVFDCGRAGTLGGEGQVSDAYPFESEFEDNPAKSPITRLVIDAWAIGEIIRSASEKELAWLYEEGREP